MNGLLFMTLIFLPLLTISNQQIPHNYPLTSTEDRMNNAAAAFNFEEFLMPQQLLQKRKAALSEQNSFLEFIKEQLFLLLKFILPGSIYDAVEKFLNDNPILDFINGITSFIRYIFDKLFNWNSATNTDADASRKKLADDLIKRIQDLLNTITKPKSLKNREN